MNFQMASPDDKDELHDIEVVLSAREKAFLELQLRYQQLLDIPANQRTEEEKKEVNRKRRSYSEQKVRYRHLVEERKWSPATGAERIEKHRQQRSDEAKEDAKAADRKRKATPAARAADKDRKAAIRNMPIPSSAEILKQIDDAMEPGTWNWYGNWDWSHKLPNGIWRMKVGEDGKRPRFPPPDVAEHIQKNHKDFIYYPPDEEIRHWEKEEYKQYKRLR